ncbi:MAG: hypothetical protein PHU43_02155 [Candidatus Bipolaricaulis sp.]|nr:hypothetical protein [Candidatus Bipolaricaulis sp.]
MLEAGEASAGHVVVADEQTAGRGRFGRSWTSPSGVSTRRSSSRERRGSLCSQVSPPHGPWSGSASRRALGGRTTSLSTGRSLPGS